MTAFSLQKLHLEEVALCEIIALRTKILRPHFGPQEQAHFEGDELETTRHYGLFSGEEDSSAPSLLGVATILMNPFPDSPDSGRLQEERAWLNDPEALQLRGMAIQKDLQGQGFGSFLLTALLIRVALSNPLSKIIWCNARKRACSFYGPHGFEVIGSEFEVPEIGAHRRMARRLPTLLA